MNSKGKAFERRVERVFKAIEPDTTIVEWNAVERDPDTNEPRQIDIRLKLGDGSIAYVECRDRRKVQSVQWIEELIGRQTSLRVKQMIAVSASGFSSNAIQKARLFGISLFKLSAFSEETLRLAIMPPKVYLRSVEKVEFEFLVSSDSLTPEALKENLTKDFPMPIIELSKIIDREGRDNGLQHQPRKRDFVKFSHSFTQQVGQNEMNFTISGQLHAFWKEMSINPFLFRKLKPGEVTVLAQISGAELPGVNAEIVISRRRMLFQIDFTENEKWIEETYCNQVIIEHQAAQDRKILFRHRGQPQVQFKFSYTVAERKHVGSN